LTPFCFAAFPGGTAGSPGTMTSSSNLGATRGGAVSLQPQGIQDRLEERKKEAEKAASADGGGWGLLLSPQYGKSKRPETELENGFQSELNGLLIGLDYRFSDKFVLGAAIGHTKDDADFINNAGFLKTTSNTFSLYGTWALSDYAYIDGYLGAGKLNLDSQRQVNFGLLSPGTASGNTSGQQTMAGLSASYKADLGRVSFEPFVNFDYIKTDVDGYDESGTTSMELRHRDRKNISTTSSVGGRSSMAYGYDWGTLVPSVHLAAVHEYKNDSSQIGNELVIAPGTPFMVDTDAPDRNYLSAGLGMAAALNGGAQLFLNYEKRMKDKLLNCWAVSAGVLVEF
ncbi:MAG: autotransporter outer membrane beta-barrel domain-containing protein, partial [Gallionellaceae bacterium]|nr:autotransporter outer membrane beta-barrel domain-containing protein [Gallionellaceae bacterium]